ncbi:GH12 family glycosyl hydrolase domain-containing protein [Archangium sp.]|uniref:GH12 family glycosyl hydrolase domain-containing protein n=1 Tax=Archangium sp. TaxID=1872627 RepID=UPI00286B6702|nr:hypothetical protein [Archangium sp.]
MSIVSTSISKNPLIGGEVQRASVTLTSTTTLENMIVDIRIYDAANNRHARKEFHPVTLPAGSPVVLTYDWPSPSGLPPGQYNVQIGVWDSSWNTHLYETRDTFTVNAPTATTPKVSIVSSSVSRNPLVAGQVQRASVTLTSTTTMQDMSVDIRIYDAANNRYARKEFHPVTLPAGSPVVLTYDWPSPSGLPPGQYNVQIGVWDSSWKTWLYETRDTFTVTRTGTGFVMNCENDAWLTAGSYAVQNNQWGRGPITDYSQCVGMGGVAADGSVSARWTWRWPAEPGEVKGYPAIVFGQKPGYPVTPNTNLPRQVNAITQLTSSWSTRSTYTGKGQLAFDLWLTRDANRYPSFPQTPITHEIMVALEPYGGYAQDNPAWFVEELTLGGIRYRVYKADDFPPGGSQRWRFLVFRMMTPMTQGTLEFKPLFDYLKSKGFIRGDEYLTSLELGTEPVEGTGEVTVDSFKATVR